MKKEMKEKVRPFLGRFEGYLQNVPSLNFLRDSALWEQYNHDVITVSHISGNDEYKSFCIEAKPDAGDYYVDGKTLRVKLGALIGDLKARYFSDENTDKNTPGIFFQNSNNQSQNQMQEMHIQILLDMQSLVEKKIQNFPKESRERTFLEKVKGSLSGVKDVSDLLTKTVSTAKAIGLSVEELVKIFS